MKVYSSVLIDKSMRTGNKKLAENLIRDYKRILKSPKTSTEISEINTFLFISSERTSSKIEKQEAIEKIENKIPSSLIKNYYKPNKSKLQKQLKRKQELIETSQIVREFIKEVNPKIVKNFDVTLKKVSDDLPNRLFNIHSKSYVTLWELPEKQLRITLPLVDQSEFEANNVSKIKSSQLIERLVMMNFFQGFLEPTISLLQDLNRSMKKLKIEVEKHHIKTINQKAQTKMELFLQIIYAKLSALHDVEGTINHIFDLFPEAEESILQLNLRNKNMDIKKEITQINSQINQAKNLLREIDDRLNQCKIREYFDPSKNEIRICQSDEEFKTELRHMSELSSDLFVEAELLKMWTDFFGADLPYFSYSTDISEKKERLNETNNHLISVRGLIKNYDLGKTTVYALRGVNLDIDQGEFIAIIGNSGAGKTTLLNCMAGLDSPDQGLVAFKGKSLHEMKDDEKSKLRLLEMGFIFQSYALLPHFSAQENIELPAVLAEQSKDIGERINQLLKGVGISNQARQFPAQLSGGQMQRVAIARALTNRPTVIFADEPTGDLDSVTGKQVMELLKQFHEETKTTIVLITHEKNIADYAQRRIILEDGIVKNSI